MRLTLDPAVGAAWAVAGGRGSAIVLSEPVPVPEPEPDLARHLGVGDVEVVVLRVPVPVSDPPNSPGDRTREVDAEDLVGVLRQWVHQAASGAGRGVALTVAGLPDGPLILTVTSWDSSARELCQRLASPQEPALAALRALLGTEVRVVDGEDA